MVRTGDAAESYTSGGARRSVETGADGQGESLWTAGAWVSPVAGVLRIEQRQTTAPQQST